MGTFACFTTFLHINMLGLKWMWCSALLTITLLAQPSSAEHVPQKAFGFPAPHLPGFPKKPTTPNVPAPSPYPIAPVARNFSDAPYGNSSVISIAGHQPFFDALFKLLSKVLLREFSELSLPNYSGVSYVPPLMGDANITLTDIGVEVVSFNGPRPAKGKKIPRARKPNGLFLVDRDGGGLEINIEGIDIVMHGAWALEKMSFPKFADRGSFRVDLTDGQLTGLIKLRNDGYGGLKLDTKNVVTAFESIDVKIKNRKVGPLVNFLAARFEKIIRNGINIGSFTLVRFVVPQMANFLLANLPLTDLHLRKYGITLSTKLLDHPSVSSTGIIMRVAVDVVEDDEPTISLP